MNIVRGLWAAGFALLAAVQAQAAAPVFDETFDSYKAGPTAPGWIFRSTDDARVRIVPAAPLGGKGLCLELVDRSSTRTASAAHGFPDVWVGEAEFRVRTGQTNQFFTLGVHGRRGGVYTWGYNNATFKYNAGKGDTPYPRPVKYRANRWMTVALRWDAVDRVFGLRVNGRWLGRRIPYPPLVGPMSCVIINTAGSRGRSQPTLWVDRVTIRRLPKPTPGGVLAFRGGAVVRELKAISWPGTNDTMEIDLVAFDDLPDLQLAFCSQPASAAQTRLARAEDGRAGNSLALSLRNGQRVRLRLGWTLAADATLTLTAARAGQPPHAALSIRAALRPLRPLHPETPLVVEGRAAAAIVAPSGPGLDGLAERVQAGLAAAAGCRLPIIPHDRLPPRDYARRSYIAIGTLESNRLLARLYELRWVRCDREYPGEGGYVVRTLDDPWGAGHNVVVLGGSDPAGVRAAVERFLAHVKPGRSLTLPRLMDIRLAPAVAARIQRPNSYSMGREGWQYYLTGREEFARRFRDKFARQTRGAEGVYEDDEISGLVKVQIHLFIYNAYKVWPLIEDSPVFSDSDRARITKYFWDVLHSKQGLRQGAYQHDVRFPRPRQNHQTHTAIGIFYMADYFRRYYHVAEADRWLRDVERFFAVHDRNPKPVCDSNGHQWWASWGDVLDYAIESGRHDVFLTGAARVAAERSIVNTTPLGYLVFTGDMGAFNSPAPNVHSMTAYFYRDGKYLYRAGRRIGWLHISPRYYDALEPLPPVDHVGIYRAALAPIYYQYVLGGPKCGVPLERAFDKLSLRSSLSQDAHYLLLDGIARGSHSYDDVNTILELWHRRRALLVTGEGIYGGSMKHHNGLVVVKDGEGGALPPTAELLQVADLGSVGFVSSRLSNYCGVDWTRHLIWRKDAFVLVLDEVQAREAGDYSLQWYWRTLGEPELRGAVFRARLRSSAGPSPPPGSVAARAAKIKKPAASSGRPFRFLPTYGALLYKAARPGDYMDVECRVPHAGEYDVVASYLGYTDRGVVQLELDGRPVGAPTDLLTSEAKERRVKLGRVRLAAGAHRIRFKVVPAPRPRRRAFFAFHYVALVPPGRKPESAPGDAVVIACANRAKFSWTNNERLGKLWAAYRYAPPVLRILRQAVSRRFAKGERYVHANLIYLSTAGRPALRLAALGDGAFAVRGSECDLLAGLVRLPSGRPGLFLAWPEGVAATDPAALPPALPPALRLAATRRAAFECDLSARRAVAVADEVDELRLPPCIAAAVDAAPAGEGPAFKLPAGRRIVTVDAFKDADALSARLRRGIAARIAAGERGAASAAEPGPRLRSLKAAWTAHARGAVLCLRVTDLDRDGSQEILFGSKDGRARALDARGKLLWSFQTGDAVWAVCSADLDGDGRREPLVGSDDAFVYALDRAGKLLWKFSPPFGPQPWIYWTLRKSKIRAIAAGDLDGDGRDEVVLGCGNMRCVAVSPQGKPLWEFRTDHGTCTTLALADLDRDGKAEVIGGKGIFSSNSHGFRLRGDGKLLGAYRNQGWTSVVCALLLTDLESDDRPEVIFGTDRGANLRVFDARTGALRWARSLGDNVQGLAAADLDRDGVKEVVAGAASMYVSAYAADGERRWCAATPDSVAALDAGDLDRDGRPDIAVGCADGTLLILDSRGRPTARWRGPAPVRCVLVRRLTRRGRPLVLVGCGDGTLAALAW